LRSREARTLHKSSVKDRSVDLCSLYAALMIRRLAVGLIPVLISLAALAPAPSAAAPNPTVQLAALACASAGNCSAIGTYDDALSDSQGLLLTEKHGAWRRGVQAQLPSGAADVPLKTGNGGGLVDIACPAAGDCTAIGRYTDATGVDHGLLLNERNGSWQRGIRVLLPTNAVAAAKPKSGSGVTDDLGLASVSCSSVGNCVAVGNYESNAEVWEGLILTEIHGKWGRAFEVPLPAGTPIAGQNAVLLSVACTSVGTCAAGGSYVDAAGHEQALLVSGSGRSWTAAPTPAAPADADTDPSVIPSAISCPGVGECAAVGTYLNPLQNSLGLLLSESGGAWQPGVGVTLPTGAAPSTTVGDQTVMLSSVACPQAGMCIAVGWYFDNFENGQPLLDDEQSGVWQPGAQATLPANAAQGLEKQSSGLDWVSCPSAGNCLATGVYTDAGYNSQGLLLSEVGGVWQPGLESPLPSDAGKVQYAAADQSDCTGAGDCAVIGQYDNSHGDVLGYAISESAGTWGKPTELTLPAANAAEAKLSLLTLLEPSGKTGTLAAIRKSHGLVYDYPVVEPGTATVTWYGHADGRAIVIGSGSVHASAVGTVQLKLHLTGIGAKTLASNKRVHVVDAASFSPLAKQPQQHLAQTFTLH
jgi:hypothetical protein